MTLAMCLLPLHLQTFGCAAEHSPVTHPMQMFLPRKFHPVLRMHRHLAFAAPRRHCSNPPPLTTKWFPPRMLMARQGKPKAPPESPRRFRNRRCSHRHVYFNPSALSVTGTYPWNRPKEGALWTQASRQHPLARGSIHHQSEPRQVGLH